VSEQSKPVAVLISDIHFTPATLELATKSLIAAQDKAAHLRVPLIIAGDILDSKALMRAECVNRLIDIFCIPVCETILIPGNHDLLNEKASTHTLNFLRPYISVIDESFILSPIGYLLPYHSDVEKLQETLNEIPKGRTIIMHQGVQTAYMGHYQQDKTSLPKEAFADFRVISGHYHRAQDIKCGRPRKGAVGLFSYIGNPYTLSFGEANDGPKGFQILYSNGLLEQVPLNLRKHVIIERDTANLYSRIDNVNTEDLVWLKVTGVRSELDALSKNDLGLKLLGRTNYKLDKIYTDVSKIPVKTDTMNDGEVLDALIDAESDTPVQKDTLKRLWREVIE